MSEKKLDCSGQSTIEFALTMILFLAFILFYFQMTMVLAFGSFVHYATFMGARAYLAGGKVQSDHSQRAQDYIILMLKKSIGQSGVDKFPGIARATGGTGELTGLSIDPPEQYNPTDVNWSWLQGIRYTFKAKLFLIPLAGTGAAANADLATVNALILTSESWLGREQTYYECQTSMNGTAGNGWFFDNGC
jgi:hypothetical protein